MALEEMAHLLSQDSSTRAERSHGMRSIHTNWPDIFSWQYNAVMAWYKADISHTARLGYNNGKNHAIEGYLWKDFSNHDRISSF